MENWTLRERISDTASADLSFYPPLVRELLYARGIKTTDDAHIFLNPDYERDIHNPLGLLGMDRAVERILRAIKKNENIIIYADYDADGIPGSVVLHDFFKEIGFQNFEVYIPHRYNEGYGLNIPAVEKFKKAGVTLIVTIDCGIANNVEVALANEFGIDVVITDHHLPGETLPQAYAIVNPNQVGDTYPFSHLCGGGLAFKLVQALLLSGAFPDFQAGKEKWLLDVAGISTMSDIVPLVGENRALAFFGLQVLKKTRRVGLLKLFQKKGIHGDHVNEDDVNFVITPHINAASRMATPRDAFTLLSTKDDVTAIDIVRFLSVKNEERKKTVENILKEADGMLAEGDDKGFISLGKESWQPGVLGLAAHRIMEKYKRPVCLWGGTKGGTLRGSCRSDGSVNVVSLMGEVREGCFLNYGGHEHSGGFSLTKDQGEKLSEELSLIYESLKNGDESKEDTELVVDKELFLQDVSWSTYDEMQLFAPFGRGNPKPLFLFRGLSIAGVEFFGREKNHLKLIFKKDGGETVEAIRFFWNKDEDSAYAPRPGLIIDILGHIEKNTFRKYPSLRLRILGLRESSL